MPFRRDMASKTLLAVAAALEEHWDELSNDYQQEITRLIMHYGGEISRQTPPNRASLMAALLEGIGQLSDLPGPVAGALADGTRTSTAILVRVTDDERDKVLTCWSSGADPAQRGGPWEVFRTAAWPPKSCLRARRPRSGRATGRGSAVGTGDEGGAGSDHSASYRRSSRGASAKLRRFANVYFPGVIQLTQKMVPLIIHVAREAAVATVVIRREREISR